MYSTSRQVMMIIMMTTMIEIVKTSVFLFALFFNEKLWRLLSSLLLKLCHHLGCQSKARRRKRLEKQKKKCGEKTFIYIFLCLTMTDFKLILWWSLISFFAFIDSNSKYRWIFHVFYSFSFEPHKKRTLMDKAEEKIKREKVNYSSSVQKSPIIHKPIKKIIKNC